MEEHLGKENPGGGDFRTQLAFQRTATAALCNSFFGYGCDGGKLAHGIDKIKNRLRA